jgi:hypothetical protein
VNHTFLSRPTSCLNPLQHILLSYYSTSPAFTMAQTGFFHHIGTFLLFVACILLIITCISAPVVHDIAILKVDLGAQSAADHRNVAFGTFGYCLNNFNGGYG